MAVKKAKAARRRAHQVPSRGVPSAARYGLAALASTTALGWGLGRWYADNPIGFSHYGAPLVDWDARREEVKEAFVTSWEAYSQHAWGELEFLPNPASDPGTGV